MKRILAFESSCDDTSVAIIDSNFGVLSNLVSTQHSHAVFGGVLPELASRLHMQNILHLTDAALRQTELGEEDIDAVAVSINPGLIGSLIVGLSFAKSLAWSWNRPLITVNHMLAHIFANFIEHPDIEAPFLALVVSGGHTELVHFRTLTDFTIIGKTRDDAAGETFDKTAKLLGLGYPGGPAIDKLAADGDPNFHTYPRGLNRKGDFDFSYSGLKTAVLEYLNRTDPAVIDSHKADIAASIQQAIIDPMLKKSITYARENDIPTLLLAGGVAANSALRRQLEENANQQGMRLFYPPLWLCVDNAAMVGAASVPKLMAGQFSGLEINASPAKGTRSI